MENKQKQRSVHEYGQLLRYPKSRRNEPEPTSRAFYFLRRAGTKQSCEEANKKKLLEIQHCTRRKTTSKCLYRSFFSTMNGEVSTLWNCTSEQVRYGLYFLVKKMHGKWGNCAVGTRNCAYISGAYNDSVKCAPRHYVAALLMCILGYCWSYILASVVFVSTTDKKHA